MYKMYYNDNEPKITINKNVFDIGVDTYIIYIYI